MVEDWREQINRLLEDNNLNMKAVSLAAGKGETFVRDILKRDRTPSADNLNLVKDAIARLSGRVRLDPAATEARPAEAPDVTRDHLIRDIEVMGSAAASEIGRGAFKFSMTPIDIVARPPGLIGAKGVYGLYVENDSMWPKYDPGDLIYVSKFRPPTPGDVVVVQDPSDDGSEFFAFVKILVRRKESVIETRQLNPAVPVNFNNRPGIVLHRVYTVNELFGV